MKKKSNGTTKKFHEIVQIKVANKNPTPKK